MDITQCACSGKTLDRLLRPVILATLARATTHGYDLVQQIGRLQLFTESPPDTSGIYKTLKSMEKEGLVSSDWDLGSRGPAKRRFALTQDGRICLKRWAGTLRTYRAQIDGLLAVVEPPRCAPVSRRRGVHVQA
jgi:DNA-binding PadR family transcriptional regulator